MKKFILSVLIILSISISSFAQYSQVESYIGEIKLFAGNFAPQGWAFCDGQTLPISQNQALFSIIGTYYGGDGVSNFKLPDLRSRVPVHAGGFQPNNLKKVQLGEVGGQESLTIQPSTIGVKTNGVKFDAQTTGRDGAPFAVQSVVVSPTSQPQVLDNRTPYVGLNYIICLSGIYPMRD